MSEAAPRIPDYLNHILEAISRIHDYTKDFDEAPFLGARMIPDAVIRNFEIIGEASGKLRAVSNASPLNLCAAIPLSPGR